MEVFVSEYPIPAVLGAVDSRLAELSRNRERLAEKLREDESELSRLTLEGGIKEAAKQDAAEAGAALVRGEAPTKPGKREAAARARAEKLRLDVDGTRAAISAVNEELAAAIEAARPAAREAASATIEASADAYEYALAECVAALERLNRARRERDWIDGYKADTALLASRGHGSRFNYSGLQGVSTTRKRGLHGERITVDELLASMELLGRELADRVEREPTLAERKAEKRQRAEAERERLRAERIAQATRSGGWS